MNAQFAGKAVPLSGTGLANVSSQLGTKAAELWSVLHVETSGCGFLADRRPKILFERHIFSKETNRQFDAQQDISDPRPGGYGPSGAHQYDRLEKAIGLNRQAALHSASWGIGQIMGFNATSAGFQDVEAMVAAMLESEDNQFIAMGQFLKKKGLDRALQSHDWAGLAHGYNGENFAQNNYDKKLHAAFAQYSILLPDLSVRAAQMLLTYRGFAPGVIDGVMGQRTRSALEEFQQKEGLAVTGEADVATLAKLST
jgi:N-acetylmuramidase/Putative peptidoglycan binding domain